MRLIYLLASSLLVAAVTSACATDKPPRQAPPPMPIEEVAPPPAAADKPTVANILIDEKLAKLCDMPTAYFAFDSSQLSNQAQAALGVLAACFTSGNAKGMAMAIVGHADPRGELTYNFGLGQRRAGTVAEHLVTRGLNEQRIESSSRGELDAVGSDESSWARDRKVEISLLE